MKALIPKTRRGEIAMAILAGVGIAGLVVVGAMAPGIFEISPRNYQRRFSTKAVDQSVENLKRKGLLKLVRGQSGWRLALTERGQTELFAYEMQQKMLKRPRQWDGKWHLLIFDIEESKKRVREQVRRMLMAFGFYRLQDSVWVHPYECEEILELLRTKYRVRYEALYIRAEKIANDHWLLNHFGLVR